MRTLERLACAAIVVGIGACAEPGPPAPAATAASPSAANAGSETVVGPPQVPWAAMSGAQRKEYMRVVVLPKMKAEFLAFDASHYANFGCATCHGDGAAAGTFKMPNPKLPKLPGSMEEFQRLLAAKPVVSEFMMKKVKPMMASLLGLPEFTPENPSGFGCMNCHTKS